MHFEGMDDPLSSEGTIPFLPGATWREQMLAVVGTLGKNFPYLQCPFPLKMAQEQSHECASSFLWSSPAKGHNRSQ